MSITQTAIRDDLRKLLNFYAKAFVARNYDYYDWLREHAHV